MVTPSPRGSGWAEPGGLASQLTDTSVPEGVQVRVTPDPTVTKRSGSTVTVAEGAVGGVGAGHDLE